MGGGLKRRIRHPLLDMVAVYRAMTPAQRIVAGLSATDLIRERLLASLRELHPDWTAEAISRAVSRRMLGAADHQLGDLLDRVREAVAED